MAIFHYQFNPSLPAGSILRSALSNLEQGHITLPKILATMQANIDGDGSDPSHFTMVTTRFGFGSNEYSKAAWEELNSCNFKLQTNASVSDVLAALNQLFTRLR